MQVFEKAEPDYENARGKVLLKAYKIINEERKDQYGEPEDNFAAIANYWTEYLSPKLKTILTAHDVALMMTLLKIARISTGSYKEDNYIDAAGYIGLANNMAQPLTEM